MLTLRRLEIDGFGPYADRAILEFPETPGVTVVYGDNMRGKTSLLNAIFYAFFGEVRGRGPRRRAIVTASNRDRAAAGRWGFSVTLSLRYAGDEYELVRVTAPKISNPNADDDFTNEVYLRRGGVALGPAERAHILGQMLPKDVARFFLFDGELLAEYEELLINESETGHKISEAIEQILGVPVLKAGRAHLAELAVQANKASAREASKHQETEAMGNALDLANQTKDAQVAEHDRQRKVLRDLHEQSDEIEGYLRTREKYAAAVVRLDAARTAFATAEAEEASKMEELRHAMTQAWRTVLDSTVRAVREKAQKAAADAFRSLRDAMRLEAIETCHCQTCDQDLPVEVRERLASTLPIGTTAVEPGDFAGVVAMARVAELLAFADVDVRPEVTVLWNAIERARMEQVSQRDAIKDLTSELADSDPETLRAKRATLSEIAGKTAATLIAIEGHLEKIRAQEAAIERISKRLSEAGTPALVAIQRREGLLREAADVFSGAVERYKAELRARVEATASTLFLSMTTEKEDYAALSINEQYGLTILHRDGRAEDSRSAGAEQVVALALMGALQANAPLRGPIVMDTPFGRLDPRHTANVVTTLPSMAEQIILFVQEGEIERNLVREILGARLLREYQLDRKSSRRTLVVEAH